MSGAKNGPSATRIVLWAGVGVMILGVILAMTLPGFIRPRYVSSANACINNLRKIESAASQFALEHNLTNGSPINFPSDLTPYIKLDSAGEIPKCPRGGTYSMGRVGEEPVCSLGSNVVPAHVLP